MRPVLLLIASGPVPGPEDEALAAAGLSAARAASPPEAASLLREGAGLLWVVGAPAEWRARFPDAQLVAVGAVAEETDLDDVHPAGDAPPSLVRRVRLARLRAARAAEHATARAARDALLQAHLAARQRELEGLRLGADRLGEARDGFYALVGHDIRSPLAVVLGNGQLLEEGLLAPGQRKKAAETIRRQAERIGQMVDDVLDRCRRADVPGGPRAVVDLGELVRVAIGRGASTHLEVDGPAPVHVDVVALEDALESVLAWARRASADRGPVVAWVGADERAATLLVRHRGPPADPLEPSTLGKGEGIRAVARFVAAHEGLLRWDPSGEGGGTLTMSLPRAAPGPAPRRVLLAGADLDRLLSFAEALAPAWEPRVAGDDDAWDAACVGGAAAIVVLDDPRALARALATPSLVGVPRLWAGDDPAAALAAGASATVPAPIDGAALLAEVRRLVLAASAARAAGAVPGSSPQGILCPESLARRLLDERRAAQGAGRPLPGLVLRVVDLAELRRARGWAAGEHALAWLAGEVRERLGPSALVGRASDDRLLALLPGREPGFLHDVGRELDEALARARPRLGAGRAVVKVRCDVVDASDEAAVVAVR